MPELTQARFERIGPMRLVGLTRRQSVGDHRAIATQWQDFMARCHEIPNARGSIPLGVGAALDGNGAFDYTCALEVTSFSEAPATLAKLSLPEQTYAVFRHDGHVASIGETYAAIWKAWFPAHESQPGEGPSLERYLPTFDPRTGTGGVEILVPCSPRP